MPDHLVRRTRVLAAQRNTSVSSLVAQLLDQALGDGRPEVRDEEWHLLLDSAEYRGGDQAWSRDEFMTAGHGSPGGPHAL